MKIKECYSNDIVMVKGRKWYLGPMVDFMPDRVQVFEIDPVEQKDNDKAGVFVLSLEQEVEEVISHGYHDDETNVASLADLFFDIADGIWVPLGEVLQRGFRVHRPSSEEKEIMKKILKKIDELGYGMFLEPLKERLNE